MLLSDHRSTDWSTTDRSTPQTLGLGFLLSVNVGRLGRSTDSVGVNTLCMSVDRLVVWCSDIDLKTLFSLIFILSTFSTSVKIFQIWVELQWTLGEIDTRSRLMLSERDWHTISAKSTHDLYLNDPDKIDTRYQLNWHMISALAIELHHYGCLYPLLRGLSHT